MLDIQDIRKKVLIKYPLFGSFLANLPFIEDYTGISNGRLTAPKDDNAIYYNPDYINRLNEKQQIAFFAHEISHVVLKHSERGLDKDPELWERACDASINGNLKKDGLELAEGMIEREDALLYSEEELYEIIKREEKNSINKKENKTSDKKQKEYQDNLNNSENENLNQHNSGNENLNQHNSGNENPNQHNSGNENPNQHNFGNEDPNQNNSGNGNPNQNNSENGDPNQNNSRKVDSNQYNSGNGNPNQNNSGNGNPNQNNSGNGDPNQYNSGNGNPNQNNSGNGNPNQNNSGNGDPNQNNSRKVNSNQNNSGNGNPNQNNSRKVDSNQYNSGNGNPNQNNSGNGDPNQNNFRKVDNDQNTLKEADKKHINVTNKNSEIIDANSFFEKARQDRIENLKKLRNNLVKQALKANPNNDYKNISANNIDEVTKLVDWRRLLEDNCRIDKDWTYQNATIEYGVLTPHMEDLPRPTVEILLDTSGSINTQLLRNFLKECLGILAYSKIKVGCFDDDFYGFQEVRNKTDIENFPLKGGGGTNFDIAVRAFSKDADNKIIFTDGLADMPNVSAKIIWVVFGKDKINPLGGKVIYINENQYEDLNKSTSVIRR